MKKKETKIFTKNFKLLQKKGNEKIIKNSGNFPIVCIGASAGGLEAFENFFGNLPENPGISFVVIQHLEPAPKNLLTGLLKKYSNLPVLDALDGMILQPDHIYIAWRQRKKLFTFIK